MAVPHRRAGRVRVGCSITLSYPREARALPREPFFGDRSSSRHLPFSKFVGRLHDSLGGDRNAGLCLSIRWRVTKLFDCGSCFAFRICGTERPGVEGAARFRSRSTIASCTNGSLGLASRSSAVCRTHSRAKCPFPPQRKQKNCLPTPDPVTSREARMSLRPNGVNSVLFAILQWTPPSQLLRGSNLLQTAHTRTNL